MAEEEGKKKGLWSKIKDKSASYKSSYDEYKARKMEEAIAKEQKELERLEAKQEKLMAQQEKSNKLAELKAKTKELKGPSFTEKAATGVKRLSEGASDIGNRFSGVGDKVSQFGGAANDFFSNLNIGGSVSGNASGNPAMSFDSFNTGMGGGFNVDTMLFGGPSKPVMRPITKRVRPVRSRKVRVKRKPRTGRGVVKRKGRKYKVKPRLKPGVSKQPDIFDMLNNL